MASVDVPPSAVEDHAATTAAEHGGAHHETFLGLDSYGWVGLGFVVFALLLWKLGAFKGIAGALDARSARIRADLEEARTLRAEAEAILAEHQRQQSQAHKDAEAIVAHARQEAAQIIDNAKVSAEAMVARRLSMAESKIAAAERAAEADLRARAATLATAAAAKVIAETADKKTRSKLTDDAITELERRLH